MRGGFGFFIGDEKTIPTVRILPTHRRLGVAEFRQRHAGNRRFRVGWSRAASSTRLLSGNREISRNPQFSSHSTKLIAVAPLQRFAGATSGTLASGRCAKAANPLVCRSAFRRLPTVESVGFERGTAAAGTFAEQKYPMRYESLENT